MTEVELMDKWGSVVQRVTFQVYYRVMGVVSIHAPIDEVYTVCQVLTEKMGGSVYWVVPKSVFRWDGVQVDHGVTQNIWVFGSVVRRRNVVFLRVGWWTLTLFTEALKTRAKRLVSG